MMVAFCWIRQKLFHTMTSYTYVCVLAFINGMIEASGSAVIVGPTCLGLSASASASVVLVVVVNALFELDDTMAQQMAKTI